MNHAIALFQQGRVEQAVARLRLILNREPGNSDGWSNLGVMLQTRGELPAAVDCYRRALALTPERAEAHNNLGVALQALDALPEAIACFERALVLKPAYVDAHNSLGVALQAEGRLDQAVASFRRALALAPEHAETRTNLAMALLLAGELAAGFAALEWRWRVRGRHDQLPALPWPRWQGEDVSQRTLLVLPEQGAGDTLQFIRFLPLLRARARAVVFLCPDALVRLLASAAGIDRLVVAADPPPPCDAFVPLLSLPHRLGTDLATLPAAVPYLTAPAPLVAERRRVLAALPGLKVGLAWRGNPGHRNDRKRSLPLALLAALGRPPGISWVCLQTDPSPDERALLSERLAATCFDPGLSDWAETAAAVMALDLVIAVDTGVAHLAGALGQPVWLLLPHAPDWRWLLERTDSPWYPSARLFRQPCPGDWAAVVAAVGAALTSLAAP